MTVWKTTTGKQQEENCGREDGDARLFIENTVFLVQDQFKSLKLKKVQSGGSREIKTIRRMKDRREGRDEK